MASLDPIVQRELIELLAPLLGGGENVRRSLLAEALGADAPALARLNWQGAAEPFALRLTEALLESDGALVRELIVWAQVRVAADRRSRFDLVELFFERGPVPAMSTVAAGGASTPILRLRVFIASPGDVAEERCLALQAIDMLNADPAYREKVYLEPVAWDRPGAGVPMLATMTPQAAIEAGLPKPSRRRKRILRFPLVDGPRTRRTSGRAIPARRQSSGRECVLVRCDGVLPLDQRKTRIRSAPAHRMGMAAGGDERPSRLEISVET